MRLVGVDIGGTFTDLVYSSEADGTVHVAKVPTTPGDPSEGFRAGLAELIGYAGVSLGELDLLSHGTTIATNALLEHRGATVGLITTAGFRDIVHIGRHQRPLNYSIAQEIPWQDRPLVRRSRRRVVPERIVPPTGEVVVPLDEDAVRKAVEQLLDDGVNAIAICFLFSYLNPVHERRARAIVEDVAPGVFVTTSSDTVSQFREFERFTTTCVNAFVGPAVASYVERLDSGLRESGLRRALHLMRSNGGVATADVVCEQPVTTLLSGPAAGVIGGAWAGENSGFADVITLDVGGTSSDIGIVTGGQAAEARARETQVAGFPLLIPIIDVHTIGAGGGSIAFVDPGGAFRVGPRSAGSVPGPAAYGNGGSEATVTDAHLVLGRLDPEHPLGGRVALHTEPAREVVAAVAAELGLSLEEAAEGILRVANHNMANAIRTKTIEKGIDPRAYTLIALGGAGPLHAADVAMLLGIPQIVVPPYPGITSAMGLLTTDLKYDLATTTFFRSDRVGASELADVLDRLGRDVRGMLEGEGFDPASIAVLGRVDCRYVGQGYELPVDVPQEGPPDLERLFAEFHRQHEREYGYAFPTNPIEIVNVRVTAVGSMPKLRAPSLVGGSSDPAPERTRMVAFRTSAGLVRLETPFYARERLAAGARLKGPAVVLQTDSTTVVPPGWAAHVQETSNLLLDADKRAFAGAASELVAVAAGGGR